MSRDYPEKSVGEMTATAPTGLRTLRSGTVACFGFVLTRLTLQRRKLIHWSATGPGTGKKKLLAASEQTANVRVSMTTARERRDARGRGVSSTRDSQSAGHCQD